MLEAIHDLTDFVNLPPQCFSSDVSFANNVADLNLDIDLDVGVSSPTVKNVQLYRNPAGIKEGNKKSLIKLPKALQNRYD